MSANSSQSTPPEAHVEDEYKETPHHEDLTAGLVRVKEELITLAGNLIEKRQALLDNGILDKESDHEEDKGAIQSWKEVFNGLQSEWRKSDVIDSRETSLLLANEYLGPERVGSLWGALKIYFF